MAYFRERKMKENKMEEIINLGYLKSYSLLSSVKVGQDVIIFMKGIYAEIFVNIHISYGIQCQPYCTLCDSVFL